MRRLIPLFLLAALVASACAQDAPETVAFRDEPVQLTVWAWEGVFDETLVKAFEAENPDVRIDIRLSSFDQHHEGMLTAIADGGTLPDVAPVERDYLPAVSARPEAFVDLREFGADDIAGNYLDWRWSEATGNDGQVLGLPTDVGGLALAYRTDLFEDAGLPSDPELVAERVRTWDDLLVLGEEFESAKTGVSFIDSTDSLFKSRLAQADFAYVNEAGESALDGSVRAAWDFTVEAIDSDLTASLSQFSPDWNEGFGNDAFATIAAPSWMRGYIASIAPQTEGKWSIVPVPGVGGNWGGSQLTIPAGGENPEAAWRFISYMTNEEAQLELFRLNGNFPSIPSLYSQPEISELRDEFFSGVNVGELYTDSVAALSPQPSTANQRDIDRLFLEGLRTYEVGRADPDDQADADENWDWARSSARELINSEN